MNSLTHLFRLSLSVVFLAGSLGPQNAASTPSDGAASASTDGRDLKAFQLIAPGLGWVLLGPQLYWTADGGATWSDITPAGLGAAALQAAAFVDAQHGWAVAASLDALGDPSFLLFTTTDGAQTWSARSLDPFIPGGVRALAGAVYLDFVDERVGWLVVKQATSSAFSLGTLFRTEDGGATWTRLAMPVGAPVHFSGELEGRIDASPPADEGYLTHDGGQTWERADGEAPAAALASPSGSTALSMATAEAAWAETRNGECQDGTCQLTAQLMQTADGGQTWTPVALPQGRPALQQSFAAPAAPAEAQSLGGLTLSFNGQGFDACYRGALSDMQKWLIWSPYAVTNLYIGGSNLFAGCGTLTAHYVQQLAQQGWLFIPTWVGPQAPCYSSNRPKMSGDPAAAYNEGRNEADLALDAAASLGLTLPDRSGTVIYYDVEGYRDPNRDDSACRAVVASFISGWTSRLRAQGNQSGVYGGTCSSYMSDFALIPNVPDTVWLARWSFSAYQPGASVWNLPCVDNTLWSGAQRLRQYTGGHWETWGTGTLTSTINIDSDVIAGDVATVRGNCVPGPGQAALFVYPNFGGQCVVKGVGDYPTVATLTLPNDTISSVRVGRDTRLRLCRHEWHGGPCEDLTADDSNLADNPVGDNQVSSATVEITAAAFPQRLFLPIIGVQARVDPLLVPNGDFESGPNSWATSSILGRPVVVSADVLASAGAAPRSGARAAWLGGADDEAAWLEQVVAVPINGQLVYWQWIKSDESGCFYDYALIWVNGTVVDGYALCGGSATSGWTQHVTSLAAYAGQVVALRIQVNTDSSLISSVFVDDVGVVSQP